MDQFNMDFAKMEDAVSQIGGRIAGLVTDAFAAAPAAAASAASVNAGFLTSRALTAAFAQIAVAVQQLTKHTNEHAQMLRTTAETVRTRDETTGKQDFNASAIFPGVQP